MIAAAASVEDVRDVVRGGAPGTRLLPVGAGTKPALSRCARDGVEQVDLTELRGVLEYDPDELTLTALAGTPVEEVASVLAEHGQHLPFDPPFAAAGATLGGVVAAGASGPGAWRHGALRDFVIGVRFVDGTGRLVAGGGKVVKNAAGFDLPKLLVGSAGRLGVIVSLSFKVFPRPAATTTLAFTLDSTGSAVEALRRLTGGAVQFDALDIAPEGRLLARLGGRETTLAGRAARVAGLLDVLATRHDGEAEQALWHEAVELTWVPAGDTLVRAAVSVRQVADLDAALAKVPGASVHYSIGATVAWIAWPAGTPIDRLDGILGHLGRPGTVLTGTCGRSRLGPPTGGAFGARIARALDPDARFLGV